MADTSDRRVDAFCFRAREARSGWNVVLPGPASTTVDVAALFAQSPEFIGLAGGRTVARVAASLGPDPAGLRLSVTVDGQGGIALVACPAKTDRATAAALVREVLGFAGRYWRSGADELLKAVEPKLGKPLAAALKLKAGAGFDEAQLRTGLGRSLEQGRFALYVLVAELDGELAAAVAHLQSLNIEVIPLGVEVYESWGIEVALPRPLQSSAAAGGPARPTPPPARPPQPTSPAQPVARPAAAAPVAAPEPAAQTQNFTPPPGFGKLDAEKPKPRPQPRPEPVREPAARPESKVWDGTSAGVMAGKRPPPKAGAPPKGQR